MRTSRHKKKASSLAPIRALALTVVILIAVSTSVIGIDSQSQFAASAPASGTLTSTTPKTCDEAKQKALQGEKENDGPATAVVTGAVKSGTDASDCFSAFMTATGKDKKKQGKKLTVDDYECHGRTSVTNVKIGSVKDNSSPSKGLQSGKCKRTVINDPKVTNPAGAKPSSSAPPSGKDEKPQAGGQPPQMPQIPQPPPDKGGQPTPPTTATNCADKSAAGCQTPPVSSTLNAAAPTTPAADVSANSTNAALNNFAQPTPAEQKPAATPQGPVTSQTTITGTPVNNNIPLDVVTMKVIPPVNPAQTAPASESSNAYVQGSLGGSPVNTSPVTTASLSQKSCWLPWLGCIF